MTSIGQSGAPLFFQDNNANDGTLKVIGVHSGKFKDNTNYGTLLTLPLYKWIFEENKQ
jgi:V8-like Glu-specific endopeptidase